MKDIVIPDGNEEEFQEMSEKLGINNLVYLYTKQPKERKGKTAFLAQKRQDTNKNEYDLILAERKKWAFQEPKVDIIFNLENTDKEDFVHHRASGLNQKLAKQARENNTAIAFNLSQLYNQEKASQTLGRMQQNVRICRKYNVDMIIASFAIEPYDMRAPKELEALGKTIGMHPKEAQQATNW